MRRMRDRVSRALSTFPVEMWPVRLARQRFRLAGRLMQMAGDLPAKVIRWNPRSTDAGVRRGRGRPAVRWDDELIRFAAARFPGTEWFDIAACPARWRAEEHAYLAALGADV